MIGAHKTRRPGGMSNHRYQGGLSRAIKKDIIMAAISLLAKKWSGK